MTNSSDIPCCRNCGYQLGKADYVGANVAKTRLYYCCPNCHSITRDVKE